MSTAAHDDAWLLEARSLTRRFGGLLAVDAVDLAVRRGSVHGLIGPNGAGKTTLLNLVAGAHRVSSGGLRFGARDITQHSSARRARWNSSDLSEPQAVRLNDWARERCDRPACADARRFFRRCPGNAAPPPRGAQHCRSIDGRAAFRRPCRRRPCPRRRARLWTSPSVGNRARDGGAADAPAAR